MAEKLKIGVVGCQGRMGKAIVESINTHANLQLSGGTISANQQPQGDVKIFASNEELVNNSDAIIDFTNPATSLENAALCGEHNCIHVIGTTGFTDKEFEQLEKIGQSTKIVWGSNMSLGVNVLNNLVEQAAKVLQAWDIEVLEMHHNKKVDAPSGTALTLGKFAAKGAGINFNDNKVASRDGIIGERKDKEIGFATLRGGTVVGEHKVIYAGNQERLELGHIATNRSIFAEGSLRAAIWANTKPNGYYQMGDVVNDIIGN